MKHISGIRVIFVTLAACGAVVEAQQPVKIPRIGFQSDSLLTSIAARIEGFRQCLRELGYIEGKNIIIEWRTSDGKLERRPEIAAELMRLKVDVIVSGGPTVTRSLREVTTTIPIVMGQDTDPVGNGFVVTLAKPGGNITGLSNQASEMSGKKLEIMKEIVPKLTRLAVLGTSTVPGNAQSVKEMELGASAFGVQLQYLDILGPKEIETVFQAASKGRADAVLVLGSPFLLSHRTQVVDLALKSGLPAIYYSTEFVEDGGLMSYGVSITDLFRRAATYVDKILKGRKPADLPVEQPTKFELVINLKTAKQIGLTIPPSVLARADKVIR